jgi:beta-glucosidase
VEPERIRPQGRATVQVDVSNTGAVDGQEVVQLYISDVVSAVTRPGKELKGFQKISLRAGETKTVTFTLGKEQLEFVSPECRPVLEPGEFRIMVGRNSEDTIGASLYVDNGGV